MLSNYQSAINARVKYTDTAAMLDPYLTAAVTSVGLSMPVAFNVSNSPITSTGTIAVTGAGTAAQYIRGDGQLATLPSGASGGSSVDYYLNGGTSQGTIGGSTYYEMSKIPVIGTGADFNRTNAQGNGLIAQFITDSLDPNRTEIPAGAWNFEMFFSASSNGGTPSYYIELLKYDGTNFTSIASGSAVSELITSGTIIDLYLSSLAVPYTTLSITDRLVIRVYVVTSGKTITLHTQNGHLCLITTSFAGGVTSLNGLAANTQYLAVDTVGSDFNINSLVDTHTFNLPTASATKRGALKSADWSTFNGKMNYADTVSLSNRINTKLNSSDTASLSNRINAKADALSGTTNTIPKFTSGTTIGNSNIKDDGNIVSVNATAGTFGALQVGNYNGNILMNTNNTSAGLIFQNTSASNKKWDFSSYNNDLSFNESNINPVMTLQAGGNVGINVTNPSNKLEVNGTFKSVGIATFGSTLSNGTYTYTLPSGTGTLALSSAFDTTSLSNRINLKLNSADTASLSNRINAKGSGTVTSIATGLGLSGGTITTSGTLLVDTSSASILSRQRAANTYATTSALSGYLPLTGGTLTGDLSIAYTTANLRLFLNNTTASTGRSWYFNSYSNGNLYVGNTTAGDIFNFSSTGAASFSSSVTTVNEYYVNNVGQNAFKINSSGSYYGMIQNTAADKWSLAYGATGPGNTTLGTSVLTWTGAGNVGIGTTSPLYTLDVNGTGRFTDAITSTKTSDLIFTNTSGGTNRVYTLLQNTSGYFLTGIEGTNAGSLVTGSTAYAGVITTNSTSDLVLGTNFTKRLSIDKSTGAANFSSSVTAGGEILTTLGQLAFSGNGSIPSTGVGIRYTSATFYLYAGANGFNVRNSANSVNNFVVADNGAVTINNLGTGTVTASSGTLSTVSDSSYKIADGFIEDALPSVMNLKPRYFYWKDKSGLDTTIRQLGFYAQEVNSAIGEEAANTPKENAPWGITDRSLIAYLTKAIQEQQAQIKDLQTEIQTLKNK
jgi:hypothetical protein